MQGENNPHKQRDTNKEGFFATLVQGLIRDTIGLWITVAIGTGVAAIICLYLGIPLIFSLVGGVLVLAVYVAWDRL